jgi:hypothetical protein
MSQHAQPFIVFLIYISLITDNVKYLFVGIVSICIISLMKCQFHIFYVFLIGLFVLLWVCEIVSFMNQAFGVISKKSLSSSRT